MYWQLLYAKETATQSPSHSENKHQWSVNNLAFCKYSNYTVIWSPLCITDVFTAFIGYRDSNKVSAPFWVGASTECQWILALHLGQFIFRLVPDIHLSDIGCHYWDKLHWHARSRILRISVNGVSTIFSFASWVLYVPICCRHPYIKYW